jgi:hypothetical protein
MGAKPLQPGTRGRRTSEVKGLRLTRAEARAVDRMAAEQGLSFSAFARRALVHEVILASQQAEPKITSIRGYLTAVSSHLHAQARRRLEEAEREERNGGSGVWGLEEAALLRRLGDALLAALPDDSEEGPA